MKRGWSLVAIGALLLLLGTMAPATERPGRFIVQGTSAAAAAEAVAAVGGELTHRLEIIDAVGARLDGSQQAALRISEGVRLFQDREAEITRRARLPQQANANNTNANNKGQNKRIEKHGLDTEYPALVDADKLHRFGIDGTGVTIAVVDTGVWTEGNQIEAGVAQDGNGRERIVAQYNAREGVATEGPILLQLLMDPDVAVDLSGHGTHVASVATSSYTAKMKGNDRLYNGIAPNADLVIVKAFDERGRGTYLDVIRGIDWVVSNRERYGIRVLNLSFSAEPLSHYWDDPLNQAVMAAWQAGIVVVASAGNRGPDAMTVGVPGNVPYVITVGAMSDAASLSPADDFLASFSSTGPTIEGFVKPEVVAPGGHIMALMSQKSVIATEHPEFHNGASYFTMSGTSQAAAVASGVAALVIQANPSLSPDDVKCRMMASARPAAEKNPVTLELELAYSVFQQGAGLINARDAVYDLSTGCANRGLDVALDLAGIQHYGGRANRDRDGSYYLMGLEGDGYTWSDGYLWSDGHKFHQGYAWSDGLLWSDGYTWSDRLNPTMAINVWVEQE